MTTKIKQIIIVRKIRDYKGNKIIVRGNQDYMENKKLVRETNHDHKRNKFL
jgi:hypothetical protein